MTREELLNIVEKLELNQVVQLSFSDLKFNIGKQIFMQNEYIVYGFQDCDLKARIVSEWSDEDIVDLITKEIEDELQEYKLNYYEPLIKESIPA